MQSLNQTTVQNEDISKFFDEMISSILLCNGNMDFIRNKFTEMGIKEIKIINSFHRSENFIQIVKKFQNCKRNVVMHVAKEYSMKGNLNVIKFLEEEQVIYVKRIGNGCVLPTAINSKNINLVKYLVEEADANIFDPNVLWTAVIDGWLECVQYLIKQAKKKGGYNKKTLDELISRCKLFAKGEAVYADILKCLENCQEK